MDTQSKVTVKANSTIHHGVPGKQPTTYNAGDTIEVTVAEAADLLAVKVIEADEAVVKQVADTMARSREVEATQDAPTTQSNNTATTQADGTVTNITTATPPSDAATPTADEISATLTSVETTHLQ